MTKSLTEKCGTFEHYEKGYSPSSLQRKYSLTYVQGYELAEQFKRLQEQLKEANEVIRYYSNFAQIERTGLAFDYLEKWGVK